MIPVDSLLKRAAGSSGLTYSLVEGSIFKGRINDISYKRSIDSAPLNIGDYNYKGSPLLTGFKVAFNTDDNVTEGAIKIN